MDNIINEVINQYLDKELMLKEYKNPKDSETLRVCTDMLQSVYESAISNGTSRREIVMEKLGNIIMELRKLEKIMSI